MSDQRRGRVFVALAAVAWSSAGLLQRELSVDVGSQLGGRALFAFLGLLVYVALVERRGTWRAFRGMGRGGALVVVLLAISSAAFLVALNHASVASVLFMQALAPMLAATLGLLLGDPVPRRTWLAMAVALGGVAVMIGGPGSPGGLGLVLSFAMTASFAAALVATRHHREVSMAPATCLSQLLVLLVAAPFASPSTAGARDMLLLVILGVAQIGLGFVFLTIGGRLIPAGEVALITMLEIVLGPLWVWLALAEQPSTATLVGGGIVLAAVLVDSAVGGGEPVPVETVV